MPKSPEYGSPNDEQKELGENQDALEMEEGSGQEKMLSDPKEILKLRTEYHTLSTEYEKIHEKFLKALEAKQRGEYDLLSDFYEKDSDREKELAEKLLQMQKKVAFDLYSFDKQLSQESPEWNFKYWVATPKIDEQKRSAGSINAPPKYETFETMSKVTEEYLRQNGFDVDGELKKYDFSPSLDATLENLKRVYGDDAEKASDYVLIRHEADERN